MKATSFLLTLFFLLFSFHSYGAHSFQFKPEMGKTLFKTKGWPNLITIKGEGTGVTGTLQEADGKITGTMTFNLKTLKTGIELRDQHMKEKYLEVEKFPTAVLSVKEAMVPKDFDGSIEFKGTLKLHNTEKEVTVKGSVEKKDDKTLKIKAKLPIKLSDFKIAIPSYKGITVAEKVKIEFESTVTFNRNAQHDLSTSTLCYLLFLNFQRVGLCTKCDPWLSRLRGLPRLPNGGALLTDYGRSLSKELMSTWGVSDSFAQPYFGIKNRENVKIGGDLRGIQTHVENNNIETGKLFLMERNVEVGVQQGNLMLVATAGTQKALRDLLVEVSLSHKGTMLCGLQLPPLKCVLVSFDKVLGSTPPITLV